MSSFNTLFFCDSSRQRANSATMTPPVFMKKQREDIQVNVAGLRRNLKNLAHNYSDAQIKVREATSNDPWGPDSKLCSEIADLTYNVVAFTEIMAMVWKRLNDHGKNWRHVYKALVLLDYLIKTGTEKVAQQCKENIYAIQTLRDFQYMEENNKDRGQSVREKAKHLVILLQDEEKLKSERMRAMKAKERLAQNATGFGSDGSSDAVSPSSPRVLSVHAWNTCEAESPKNDLECARPQTVGEEELQLQLAIAMSREEAEQEEQKKRSDDVRLQLALSQSENEFKQIQKPSQSSHMLDLLDVAIDSVNNANASNVDPWGMTKPTASLGNLPKSQNDSWSSPGAGAPAQDPWAPVPAQSVQKPDPWSPTLPQSASRPVAASDPWAAPSLSSLSPTDNDSTIDEFAAISKRNVHNNCNNINNSSNSNSNGNNNNNLIQSDPFDLNGLSDDLLSVSPNQQQPARKTPHSFLGENSALVNLDNLVSPAPPPIPALPVQSRTASLVNPFSTVDSIQPGVNNSSFQRMGPSPLSFNQLSTQQPLSSGLPQPLIPQQQANPFLS
ncbi:epsin-2 isoform X1 [Bemisia tabaci]|uniref:epsin-2 isoform X1 n=2 Tax=Bemisia tabaci TaxID=7038 RepID=UPI003B282220